MEIRLYRTLHACYIRAKHLRTSKGCICIRVELTNRLTIITNLSQIYCVFCQ
ncbi:13942_t:CDS:1, partial [Gigaspora rosea]